ncbi:MAG TPA: rhodanese-like domain-containing protein [Gemmatimonadaceae bacterium]|jgi:hydroxyacylglutathione hydrolase|nr:rhodanese-like domain-containing protein [Gemmatimonadaceae bacterium]
MLLTRIYEDGLAQAAYLVACDQTSMAMVVDPNRDVDRYLEEAARAHVTIVAVTETHIHADFVSGSRELARRAGAQLLLSGDGGADWQYAFAAAEGARLLHDGDRFDVGTLSVSVIHTPGHTPEHVSLVVTDTAAAPIPVGMFSGDFLFAGDVGRPDLLERAAKAGGTMEPMARRLYRSLHAIDSLPAHLQVWPGHGPGSACGKALGAIPSTTLGYERLANWAFQAASEEDFVRAVLAGQPEPPRYFARMKSLNRDGPPAMPPRGELSELGVDDLRRALASNVVIDARPSAEFAQSHIPGSMSIPFGTSFATWAGTLIGPAQDIVLLADEPTRVENARRMLALIGFDRVVGWAGRAARSEWAATDRLANVEQVDLADVTTANHRTVIDVRGAAEWDAGHIPNARHLFLGDLPNASDDLPRDLPIAIHCQGGTRASIAASMLQAKGFTNVATLKGGMDAWTAARFPVERSHGKK